MDKNEAEKRGGKKGIGSQRQTQVNQQLHHNNIPYHRSPRRRKEKRREGLFEQTIADNFGNLRKETDIKIQEIQRTATKFNKNLATTETYSQNHKIHIQES